LFDIIIIPQIFKSYCAYKNERYIIISLFSVAAKYCNSQTKIALVRIRHGPHKLVLQAIPLINDVGGRFVKMNILYMGATMKHCFLFIRVGMQ